MSITEAEGNFVLHDWLEIYGPFRARSYSAKGLAIADVHAYGAHEQPLA
jgi:hypothetical protein